MDYPHGHHRPDPRDEEYQYPPPGRPHAPPHYGVNEPPPPQVYHSSHSGPGPDSYHPPPPGRPHGLSPYGVNEPPPPQSYHTSHSGPGPDSYHGPPPPQAYHNSQFGSGPEAYDPPPPPQAYHTSHSGPGPEMYQPPPQAYHTSHSGPGHSPPRNPGYGPPPHQQPHMPAIFDHQSGHKEAEWTKKASVRMYTKAETNYSLTIRDGKVILARSDPSDPYQQWVKDEKFSTKVKDEEGFPSFALVNKATGQAMKHSIGATHPVQLIPYNPDVLDESVLWTESRDLGDSYRTIRMVNNIRLNVDALNGDKNHGGVRDGTTIVLWEWKKGDNQRWKIVRHCKHYTKFMFSRVLCVQILIYSCLSLSDFESFSWICRIVRLMFQLTRLLVCFNVWKKIRDVSFCGFLYVMSNNVLLGFNCTCILVLS